MQSLRGLRRAIPSMRPRHGFLLRRSFTGSSIWRNGEQSSMLGQGPTNRIKTAKDVDDNKTTAKPSILPNDIPSPEPPAVTTKQQQDLCYAVTAVMAKMPHPAVVITTLDRTYSAQLAAGIPPSQMRHPIARGITASSLTSLCIRPRPHVTFNMNLPSTMYDALVACRDFNVHVLTPDEVGAGIASVFARGNRLSPSDVGATRFAFDIDADLGVFVGLKGESFRDVEIANREKWHEEYLRAKERGDSGAETPKRAHCVPCLRSKGVMEVLHCRLVRTIHPEIPAAANNVIIIGEVVGVTLPSGPGKANEKPVALGYADRKYRAIGDVIEPLK